MKHALATSADNPHDALDFALAGISANPHAQDCYAAAIQAHLQSGNDKGAQMIYRDLLRRLARSGASLNPAIASVLPAHISKAVPLQPTRVP